MKSMKRAVFLLFLITASMLFVNSAFAAMGEIQSFTFKGTETDLLGTKETLKPDGKPDAHFIVSIKAPELSRGWSLKL